MNTFKKCTFCGYQWPSRQDFLDDASTDLIGYQVNFDNINLGFFLFNHLSCGTTLGIAAEKFKDLYRGSVYAENLLGTEQCPEYCLHENRLDPCPAKCECAYVRDIIQTVRNWRKYA